MRRSRVKSKHVVKARYGSAFRVARGEYLKAINFHGTQAADVWAFSAEDPSEFSAVDHTRSFNSCAVINVGLALMSSKRRPMLTLVEDTSQGRHDTILCPCSAEIYQQLGCTTYHRSCTENLHEALAEVGLTLSFTPAPLNLFMRVDVLESGAIDRRLPTSKPGAYALFRADMDLVVAVSACPQDITPINGPGLTPHDIGIEILTPAEGRAQ